MPPKSSTIHLSIKSHRTSVFLTVPTSTTLGALRETYLSALSSFADTPAYPTPAASATPDDVRFHRGKRAGGAPEGAWEFERIDGGASLASLGLRDYDALFVGWRNRESGEWEQVDVTVPSLDQEDEVEGGEGEGEEDDEVEIIDKKGKGRAQ